MTEQKESFWSRKFTDMKRLLNRTWFKVTVGVFGFYLICCVFYWYAEFDGPKGTPFTSDGLEQVIILGQGGVRMSALGLKKQIESAGHEIREMCTTKSDSGKVYLFHETSDDVKKKLDEIRLEKNDKKIDKKIDIGKQGEK